MKGKIMNPDRRRFLRAAGVSIALPCLDAFRPRLARGATSGARPRMVFICAPLGVHAPNFFPAKNGREYDPTPYLEPLQAVRGEFTVISGLAHPDVAAGHDSGYSFLTGARHQGFMRSGFRNTISVDQLAAERRGGETRVPSLSLACEGSGISWTRSGALVPSANFPSAVFRQLFVEGTAEAVEAERRRLRYGQSLLDQVRDQARSLGGTLGAADREKLEEYLTSVRELEERLARSEEWSKKPKPKVEAKPPQDAPNGADFIGKARLWFDLTRLAIQTDSTRLVTILLLGTSAVPPVAGVSLGHHDLSHHGQDPNKLAQLKKVELELMTSLGEFLAKMKEISEEEESLLDRTMVFFGSNLGNASSHATANLPVLFAGGGFKHGQHLAFAPAQAPPLCNLFVTMLQRFGLDVDQFGTSTGTLPGL
ncbi:MAG TPA: DUF1552 domain-containing protein [Planctomycetota bacterium]|nr:DUF1552 domain-containing protein [Planctomycetota bacterium]